jgi:CRP-like cAMP-binding protein
VKSQMKIQKEAGASFGLKQPEPLSLDEGRRAFLDGLGPLQRYPPAIELFKQHAQAQDIYIVEHGLVKLIRLNQEGREMILGLRSPGWVLGDASVVLQKPYAASAFTLTYCHLRRIPAESFIELLQTNAHISWYFHQLQSREIYNQIGHMEGLGFLSARHRLEQLLWQLVSTQRLNNSQEEDLREETRLNLPLKQTEIAELIAVTPEHLSRVLKQMQNEGILRREKGWIIIADPQKLQHAPDLL